MMRFCILLFVLWCFPGMVAQMEPTQAAKVCLDFTDDKFNENVNTLAFNTDLQELELLIPERALGEDDLVQKLSALFQTSTTLQKIRLSLPHKYAACGNVLGSNANPFFESLAKNKKAKILEIDHYFAFLSTENVIALTTLISQNFLQELSVGLGKDWKSCDYFALRLVLGQDTALTKLFLTIVSISEEDARSLVNAIKTNKTLAHVRLILAGGDTEGEVAKIKAIFQEAQRG